MGSTRFPGKVMMEIAGKPMLHHLLDRLEKCRNLDEIVVATSVKVQDDVIFCFCEKRNVPCFRGSEEDVLGRMLGSFQDRKADLGVVVYGDNPLIDPCVVDEHITLFKSSDEYDWVGNDLKTTFPSGMDVEVFSVTALEDSAARTNDPVIREHGTLYIRKNPQTYRLLNVEAEGARRRPDLYLGIDTDKDAQVVKSIVQHFEHDQSYTLEQIIAFLDCHPELAQSNRNIIRRWRKYRDD